MSKEREFRRENEILKWEKEQNKQAGKYYFLMFIIVVSLVYAIDEITSSINGTIKTDAIKFFYNIVGSDVNSKEFIDASGNFFLLSMLLYSGALIAPFYKALADKYGRKLFLVLNTCLMGIGLFICMIAPNLIIYLVGNMIIIFSTPNDFQVMYIMEVAPKQHRNKIASITKAIGLLSVSLLGVLRFVFVPDGAGSEAWRGVFIIPIICAVVIAVFSFFAMNETPTFIHKRLEFLKAETSNKESFQVETTEENSSKEAVTGGKTSQKKKKDFNQAEGGVGNAIRYIIKNKQLSWIFIAGVMYAVGSGATNYYESVFQLMGSQEAVSVAIICFPIANALITSVSGFISDKLGRKKAVLYIGIAACITLVTYVASAMMNLGGVVVGVAYGIFVGCLYSASDILFLVLPAESTQTNLRASVVGTMSLMLFVGTAASWGVIILAQSFLKDWGLASLITIPFLLMALAITMIKVKETNGVDLDSL